MAKAKNTKTAKPFAVKGQRFVSPKGASLWCKVKEPDYQYNAKGILSVTLVCDPEDELVQAFIEKLEDIRDEAFLETKETLGAVKGKGIKARDVYADNIDSDGEETGLIEFKFSLKDVDDKDSKIKVVDSKRNEIKNIPLIGNGSIIRCMTYANPYYMASTKEVGISLIWEQLQLVKLEEYLSGDGFDDLDDEDEDDAYVAPTDFDDDDEDDAPAPKAKTKTKVKAKAPVVVEDDEDDEDEDEVEEEEAPKPKAKAKAKPKAKPVAPKPTTTKRKVVPVDDEGDDEVEDDDF